MSGFAGIVRFDGVPIDRELFARFVRAIEYRGVGEESHGEGISLAGNGPVVWDGEQLTCTRDPFGLRPFFYAIENGALLFTNDHSALASVVDNTLHDETVADYLLFSRTTDIERTAFRAIRRLPPAHQLVASAEGIAIRRYWSPPIAATPRRISEADAVAEFRALFLEAVKAHIPADGRVVISMSGGVDSTAVAAALRQLGAEPTAVTTVWDSLGDPERHWSSVAASHLGIAIDYLVCDGYRAFDGWRDDLRFRGIEPAREAFSAPAIDLVRRAARHGRVLFTGQGGDAVFRTGQSYFADLLRGFRLWRFASDAAHYAITRRKRPPFCLRSRLRAPWRPDYPAWIDPDLERRFDLRERFRAYYAAPPRQHPFRDDAYRNLTDPVWSLLFEQYDASATGVPVEVAAPFFDLRLVEFLLSLPPMPHFADKDLLRRSMEDWLPDVIRFRPKTPAVKERRDEVRRDTVERSLRIVHHAPTLERWVSRRILSDELQRECDDYRRHQQGLAVGLAAWLHPETL